MMTRSGWCTQNFRRKALRGFASFASGLFLVVLGSMIGSQAMAQSASATAPPPLFTAIQEQIGLKLEAGKVPVEVIVIDHVEKPSAN